MIAYIRGVGQTDFNFAVEPGVGIYVDDVYFSTLTGSLLDLLDLDRVEILRGPQGTLAGRNSIGGAIKLYSVQPGDDEGGKLQATFGDYDRVDFRGSAGFTLVEDKLYARIAGASRARDGYVKRLDYGCVHPESGIPTYNTGHVESCELGTEGGISYTAARAALKWTPDRGARHHLFRRHRERCLGAAADDTPAGQRGRKQPEPPDRSRQRER